MSIDATRWAWQQTDVSPAEKLILLSLADRAGEHHTAYPSLTRLTADTCLHRETVCSALRSLEAKGLLRRCTTPGRSNVYQLLGVTDRHEDTRSETRPGATRSENRPAPGRKTDRHPVGKPTTESTNESTNEPNTAALAAFAALATSVERSKKIPSGHNRTTVHLTADGARSTRDRGLLEDLTDRSWAD